MERIKVGHLLRGNIGVSELIEVDDHVEIEDANPLAVSGQLQLIRTEDGIRMLGKLTATQILPCDRCLEDAKISWPVEFDQLFSQTKDIAEEVEPIKDFSIDAEKVIREDAQADRPMFVHCQPDCLGLCQVCGANLNQNPNHTH